MARIFSRILTLVLIFLLPHSGLCALKYHRCWELLQEISHILPCQLVCQGRFIEHTVLFLFPTRQTSRATTWMVVVMFSLLCAIYFLIVTAVPLFLCCIKLHSLLRLYLTFSSITSCKHIQKGWNLFFVSNSYKGLT